MCAISLAPGFVSLAGTQQTKIFIVNTKGAGVLGTPVCIQEEREGE
jgi:hypothetical protein